jgi:hypothetical protein
VGWEHGYVVNIYMIDALVSAHDEYDWMLVLRRGMFFQNALIIIFWTLDGIPAAMLAASSSKA